MTLTRVLLSEAKATYAVADKPFRRVSDDELSWTPPAGREWMTVGRDVNTVDLRAA